MPGVPRRHCGDICFYNVMGMPMLRNTGQMQQQLRGSLAHGRRVFTLQEVLTHRHLHPSYAAMSV